MNIDALNRVAAELRGMLADAPKDDPDVAGLLRDCERLEQLASEMTKPIPATLSTGTWSLQRAREALDARDRAASGVRSDATERINAARAAPHAANFHEAMDRIDGLPASERSAMHNRSQEGEPSDV